MEKVGLFNIVGFGETNLSIFGMEKTCFDSILKGMMQASKMAAGALTQEALPF
jgi:hypothetical protein